MLTDYEWDYEKARLNIEKHGVAFETVHDFEWETALVLEDDREDYGEERYRAMGYIGTRLYALVFTFRGDTVRVISLRQAARWEQRYYEANA